MTISRRTALSIAASGMAAMLFSRSGRTKSQTDPLVFDTEVFSTPHGTDDASGAFQAFLDSAPAGATVTFPRGARLRLESPIVLTKPVHVDGARAEVFTTGTNTLFVVPAAASSSSFRDLRLRGASPRQFAPQNKAFHLAGVPGGWVDGLRFVDVTCDGFGYGGFYGSHVKNASFRGCAVTNSVYCGFQFLSPKHVTLYNPVVDTLEGIAVNGFMQSYPIAWTRDSSQSSIEDFPNAEDCTTWGGLIQNSGWEGVDTHGGIRIRTIGTKILGCMHGVSYVPCPDQTGRDRWAPRDCLVAYCEIDSLQGDASKAVGIRLVGAGGYRSRVMAATGAILGNRIKGHGRGTKVDGETADPINVGGGIQMYQTDSVRVAGNAIVEPNPFGICLWYDNTRCELGSNTVQDPWSNTFASAAAVSLRAGGNSVNAGAVRLVSGSKDAKHVNIAGVYDSSPKRNRLILSGGEDFAAAVTPVKLG